MAARFIHEDRQGWRLVVGAQVVLERENGKKVGGGKGDAVIEELIAPSEKYPMGTFVYRVLEDTQKGTARCDRVRLVKPTDKMLRDKTFRGDYGIKPPTKRR